MKTQTVYPGLVKVYIGAVINLVFYTLLFIFDMTLLTIITAYKSAESLEVFNMVGIALQVARLFAYFIIWYGLSEIENSSKCYRIAKYFTFLHSALFVIMLVLVNSYDIYIVNSQKEAHALFIYSNILLLAASVFAFFVVNGYAARNLLKGEEETLHKYGAEEKYIAKTAKIQHCIMVLTRAVVVTFVLVAVLFSVTNTSLRQIIIDIVHGHFMQKQTQVVISLFFGIMFFIFLLTRLVAQVYIVLLTKKTYQYVDEISK